MPLTQDPSVHLPTSDHQDVGIGVCGAVAASASHEADDGIEVPSLLPMSQIPTTWLHVALMGFQLFSMICCPSLCNPIFDKELTKSNYFLGKMKFKGEGIHAS